jgi:mannose/cellobiose epimerase-like protein (N-acyl-D-glucosamine 2-epimerase family)
MNTARMTHSFAMAHIQGCRVAELVEHGVAALQGPLRDAARWLVRRREHHGNTGKAAYLHAFVALAASSAVVAGVPAPRPAG